MLKNPVPTVDELLPKLNNANAYSCVKVYKRFTNVELDKNSSFLNTIKKTLICRHHWLCMPFIDSLRPEQYQSRQRKELECLTGIVNNADDISVLGCGDRIEEAEKDHDIILWNLMLSCRDVNLKLNPRKFPFKVKQVTWMGHFLSSSGITSHPDRVRAFVDTNPPQDVKGIQRILDICNYLSRFTPNLAEIVKPLTELSQIGVVWSWSAKHDIVFDTDKSVIANATTLRLFDVNKACVLQVDASDTGLGEDLLQDGQPMAFNSSTLSATEVNYAPIAKERLSIERSMYEVLLVSVWEER